LVIIITIQFISDIQKQAGIIDAMPAFSLNNEVVYMTGKILLQPQEGVNISRITALVNNEVEAHEDIDGRDRALEYGSYAQTVHN
jgi:hypothetical protein